MDTKVWKHSQKRGQELMKLIELDVVNYDLFEMAPVKEYELYIKSFGRSDTKQVCGKKRTGFRLKIWHSVFFYTDSINDQIYECIAIFVQYET